MGYNATVVVLVDRLNEIEEDPEFGKKLAAAVRYRLGFPRDDQPGCRPSLAEATGQTQVVEVHHADYQIVVTVGGNTGRVLGVGGWYNADDDAIIRALNPARPEKKRRKRELRGGGDG